MNRKRFTNQVCQGLRAASSRPRRQGEPLEERKAMAEQPRIAGGRAARRAKLRHRYRRRRLTALAAVAGLVAVGVLVAGFVGGRDPVRASSSSARPRPGADRASADRPAEMADGPPPDGARRLRPPGREGRDDRDVQALEAPVCRRDGDHAPRDGGAHRGEGARRASPCSASATTRSGSGGGATTGLGRGSSTSRRRSCWRPCAGRARASSCG